MHMAYQHAIEDSQVRDVGPTIRKIGTADLFDALAKGVADFNEKPSHLMFLTLIYPVIALVLARLSFGYDVLPLLFPLAAGFALLGPLAAVGLYELSRRREQGQEIVWSHAFGVRKSPSRGAIIRLGLILLAIFALWIFTAHSIYSALFGDVTPASVSEFANQILYTWKGWALIIVGNAVGFLFALVVLTISVVSFPLLLDRKVGASEAMATSIKAVLANPRPMLLWGLIVAVGLLVGSIPFFVGLCIVLPVLGHSTWHLYRKVVA
jgi:uncharacterized membrane protein